MARPTRISPPAATGTTCAFTRRPGRVGWRPRGWNRSRQSRASVVRRVFTGDFVLEPGSTHRVVLRYRLPESVPLQPYHLYVRKQAGTAGWPLTISYGACREETTLTSDFRFECPPPLVTP